MTEKMLDEAKKDFEKKLEVNFDYFHKPTKDGLMRAFEDAIRDNVPVSNLCAFPVHDFDEYYGMDNEELLTDCPSGWDDIC